MVSEHDDLIHFCESSTALCTRRLLRIDLRHRFGASERRSGRHTTNAARHGIARPSWRPEGVRYPQANTGNESIGRSDAGSNSRSGLLGGAKDEEGKKIKRDVRSVFRSRST